MDRVRMWGQHSEGGVATMQTALRHWDYYGLTETFSELFTSSERGEIFNRLYEVITAENNILLAYRSIKANKGGKTAGTDGYTIDDVKTLTKEKLINAIRKDLENYKPNKVRRVYIPKANGKQRPLGIPTMRDRIIQQMFKQVLEPIAEAKFYPHSYGFRPLRNARYAISRCNYLIHKGYYHVVDVDIKSFFDNVNHRRLIKQIRKTWEFCGVWLIPPDVVVMDVPPKFPNGFSPYTEYGREQVGKMLSRDIKSQITKLSLQNYDKYGIEYADNRLSRYSMRKGKCEITQHFLTAEEVNTHHFIPITLGGTHSFDNLRIIHKEVHKLVHAKDEDTIKRLLRLLQLTVPQIAKVNQYRKACNLELIRPLSL